MEYDSCELQHHGVAGQRWYHRWFQTYQQAPTRSGKIGTFHGKSKEAYKRVKEENDSDSKNYIRVKGSTLDRLKNTSSENQVVKKNKNDNYSVGLAKGQKVLKSGKPSAPSKNEIMNDPRLLLSHRYEFTEEEVTNAVNRMRRIDSEDRFLSDYARRRRLGGITGKLDSVEDDAKRFLRWYQLGKKYAGIAGDFYRAFEGQ